MSQKYVGSFPVFTTSQNHTDATFSLLPLPGIEQGLLDLDKIPMGKGQWFSLENFNFIDPTNA